jgi:hypothetical protein
MPSGAARELLTTFVTSAHLVRAFKDYRNRDDKLSVSLNIVLHLLCLFRFHCVLHFAFLFRLFWPSYADVALPLQIAVCLPDYIVTDGFLGLYDDDIAIVTCLV